MKKYLLVVLIVAWSNQVFSTDIDLYIDDSDASVQRPNVLIILDNSPSMVWYGVDGTYLSDRQVNNPLTRANVARRIVIDLINDNPELMEEIEVKIKAEISGISKEKEEVLN